MRDSTADAGSGDAQPATRNAGPLTMADLTTAPEIDTEAIADFVRRARDVERELRKVIVGQQEAVGQVLIALFAGGHVLLEGVPGLGKTLLVRTLGDVLSLRFNRIQFTPDP